LNFISNLIFNLLIRIAKEKEGNTKVVVIKALRAPFLSPAAAKYTLRELTLLSTLKHPNVYIK